MIDLLTYPFDPDELLRKKKAIKRALQQTAPLIEKRIAILGGSTTAEIKDILELFLLQDGIQPIFYESEYNKYFEDIMFDNEELAALRPDLIYIHTTAKNITAFPSMTSSEDDISGLLNAQQQKFIGLWQQIEQKYKCAIVQNNFEHPRDRPLGNLDATDRRGKTLFINRLNQMIANYAADHKNFYVQDLNYLAAWVGLENWYDNRHWYAYKYAMSIRAIPMVAHNLASLIKAIFGRSRKCAVLDLDNTLWGGVIGDDGAPHIKIGPDSAEAESFQDFQIYLKDLKLRGVLLAVCSKNDVDNAKQGLAHPDGILRIEDFAAFEANWDTKPDNVRKIARAINLGEDALVFIDDNPAERAIVRAQVPNVTVPEIGDDPARFVTMLDKSGFFETVALSDEDLQRHAYYEMDVKREKQVAQFKTYREFLDSLEMSSEIAPFATDYLARITQLINKTNQFNLTTRRYTYAEVQAFAKSPDHITLYGRLADKFGDNGLITCLIGHIKDRVLQIDLWLMSCRVLKREMEQTIFDQLVLACKKRNICEIVGSYIKSSKNAMVSEHYKTLGFSLHSSSENGDSVWRYTIDPNAVSPSRPIRVTGPEGHA